MIAAAPLPPEHTALLMIDAREEYVAPAGWPELRDGLSALAMAAGLPRSARGRGRTSSTCAREAAERRLRTVLSSALPGACAA